MTDAPATKALLDCRAPAQSIVDDELELQVVVLKLTSFCQAFTAV
jgi:hypothetical protein